MGLVGGRGDGRRGAAPLRWSEAGTVRREGSRAMGFAGEGRRGAAPLRGSEVGALAAWTNCVGRFQSGGDAFVRPGAKRRWPLSDFPMHSFVRFAFRAVVGACYVSLVAALSAAEGRRDPRPNIVFILLDDLGKEWISAYGAEDIRTPHLDALAAGGTKFENFYVMPQCTPTRLSFLTGQYPFRHGWVNHWDVPRWGGGAHYDWKRNPSIARTLRAAGYRTAVAGKWQINDFRVQPEAMRELGFDAYCMWTGGQGDDPAFEARLYAPDRMERRFRMFEKLALPSLLAQTDDDFRMVFLIGRSLPDLWRDRLTDLIAPLRGARVVALPSMPHYKAIRRAFAMALPDTATHVTGFRLDDDDAMDGGDGGDVRGRTEECGAWFCGWRRDEMQMCKMMAGRGRPS